MDPEETEETPDEGLEDIDALVDRLGAAPSPAPAEPAPAPAPAAPAAPAAPETPPEPPPDDRTQRSLEMIARQEGALRQQQEAFKAAQAEFEARQKEHAEALGAYQRFREKFVRQDVRGALEDLGGVDIEAIAKAAREGRGVNPVSALEETVDRKLTETEKRIQEQLQQLEAKQQAVADAARQADEAQFRSLASAKIAEKAPLLAAWGPESAELVRAHYEPLLQQRHRGEQVSLPPIEDAVAKLEEDTLNFLKRFVTVPAARALFQGTAPQPKAAAPTLTARQAATVPTQTVPRDLDIDSITDRDDAIDALLAKHGS